MSPESCRPRDSCGVTWGAKQGLEERSDPSFKVCFSSLEYEQPEGRGSALLAADPQPWKSTGTLITLSKYLNERMNE